LQFYLDYKNGVIDFKSNDFAQSIYLWRNQKNDIVDYVLPSHVSHDGKFLQIPSAYLFLISVYIYASMKSENLSKFNIPEITATLSYNDIGGDDHEETFAFYPHIIMIGAEEFRGYFDINKKLMKK